MAAGMDKDEVEVNKVVSAQDGTQAVRRKHLYFCQKSLWLMKIPNGEGIVIVGIKQSFSMEFTILQREKYRLSRSRRQ
jgi:hypothetical protein